MDAVELGLFQVYEINVYLGELYSQADFYTTRPKLAQCRNDSTVLLFSQNVSALFSLLLSDDGDNILYHTKNRKKAGKKDALLACHSGQWTHC